MRVITKGSKRSMITKMSVVAAFGAMCVATPQVLSAQDMGGIDMGAAIQQAIQEAMSKVMNRKVGLTPAIVNVDAKAKTATLEFANNSEDTLVAKISVGLTAPVGLGTAPGASEQAGGLLADDEPSKQEAIDAKWSLASWVKDLPETITLAPGAKKSVTIKLDVPATANDGEYSAWVLASTEPAPEKKEEEGSGIKLNFEGGAPKMTSGTKLIYRVAAPK